MNLIVYIFIITGKIEYFEEDVNTSKEKKMVIDPPRMIFTPKKGHLLIAIEDSVFFEIFDQEYSAVTYPKYRKIVEEKMKDSGDNI